MSKVPEFLDPIDLLCEQLNPDNCEIYNKELVLNLIDEIPIQVIECKMIISKPYIADYASLYPTKSLICLMIEKKDIDLFDAFFNKYDSKCSHIKLFLRLLKNYDKCEFCTELLKKYIHKFDIEYNMRYFHLNTSVEESDRYRNIIDTLSEYEATEIISS